MIRRYLHHSSFITSLPQSLFMKDFHYYSCPSPATLLPLLNPKLVFHLLQPLIKLNLFVPLVSITIPRSLIQSFPLLSSQM